MNKKIKEMIQKEYGEFLDYIPIKTKDEFLKNYKMHDIAQEYLISKIIDLGIKVTPLGKDLREKRVIMKNEIPDFYIERYNIEFAFDIKSKSSIKYFGWINERAVKGYKKFSCDTGLNVYAFFVLIKDEKVVNKIGFSNINEKELKIERAWDGNIIYKYKWNKGLPRDISFDK